LLLLLLQPHLSKQAQWLALLLLLPLLLLLLLAPCS
jgi:hypothetical protein